MLRKFYKMHGIGNDYIYFDCMSEPLENAGELAVRLSDRHFSIGGDGVILLLPSDVADCRMRMFNADGSEGKMCGNGVRCVGKLAHDLGYVKGDTCSVETLSGIKTLQLNFNSYGLVGSARVDMGAPIFAGDKIPSTLKGEKIVAQPAVIGGKEYKITLVSMGNPHCVVFEMPDWQEFASVGRQFETSPLFPERVNAEFVRPMGRNELKMRGGSERICGYE